MPKIIIDESSKTIRVPLPLTANSGKIRIKNRSILNEYGIPVSTKNNPFKMSNYVEWQIGYDAKWGVIARDGKERKTTNSKELEKIASTTLEDKHFVGANGFIKSLYELSEYAYYFHQWKVISRSDLWRVSDYVKSIPTANLLDNNAELRISRDNFVRKTINGLDFSYTQVKYPLLVHSFGNIEAIAEIKITEKQRAIGTMPMLYICVPITELSAETTLLGRCAKAKETADFTITPDNIHIMLDILTIFGTLSEAHRHDILEIIKTIVD